MEGESEDAEESEEDVVEELSVYNKLSLGPSKHSTPALMGDNVECFEEDLHRVKIRTKSRIPI